MSPNPLRASGERLREWGQSQIISSEESEGARQEVKKRRTCQRVLPFLNLWLADPVESYQCFDAVASKQRHLSSVMLAQGLTDRADTCASGNVNMLVDDASERKEEDF